VNEQQREEHAKRLLSDPLFLESFDVLRTELLTRWENSSSNESEAREAIWLGLQLLARVKYHLESVITTGKMTEMLEKQSPYI
jgi:hypothetical protein|tara:strand:+ start:73 stop:321 length:249 start_codon:yes stop_codon:yes gene_type:complete